VRKTNKPSAAQLASLQLREGANSVVFKVHSGLQGKQELKCTIYLLSPKVKIVVSDIDGTITKSDVLGHIYPRVGVDWSHSGVSALHAAITANGYQMVYLTARGIGMASTTREYLASIKQGEDVLPQGPCLLSPSRLFESLTREVIRRNPEEFKIACLTDIRELWPPDYNPFYAGFGNQPSDEMAYLAAGIPRSRILIINPTGEIRISGQTYCYASYPRLLSLAHQMFPAVDVAADAEPAEDSYSDLNFWRRAIPPLEELEAPAAPVGQTQQSLHTEVLA